MINKYDQQRIDACLNKTVKSIKTDEEWRESGDIDGITITFTDGTSISIGALNGAGCSECDEDGCNGGTLNIS